MARTILWRIAAPMAALALVSAPAQAGKVTRMSVPRLSCAGGTQGAADGLIAGLVVPPVGDGYLDPGVTSAYIATLTSFNEGAIGPGPCVPPDPGEDDFVPPDPGPDRD